MTTVPVGAGSVGCVALSPVVAGLADQRVAEHGTAVLTMVGAAVLWCAPRVVGFMTTVDRVLIGTLLTGTSGQPEAPAPW